MDKIVQKQAIETVEYPYKELTRKVIGAVMEVHRNLRCGFLESVYEAALAVEFRNQKVLFEQQRPIDVYYKDSVVKQFFCDFLVDEALIVELKAVKQLTDIEIGQVLNYLKATNMKLGLLLNFGTRSLEYKRVIN
ncbi:MAG: GxxExxY protein [Phycisphaerales bacterium]|jgi:GxxExxY protein